jgi:hypothetical protein
LAGYGSQLGDLGATQQRLAGQDIGMLEGLGSVNRGIDQQRLNNQYNQEYATRMAPTQAASYIQGFAPQYQGSTTQVNKLYGMPVDPRNAAIAAGTGTYNSLKQPNTEYQPSLTDRAEADYWAAKQKDIQDRQRTYTPQEPMQMLVAPHLLIRIGIRMLRQYLVLELLSHLINNRSTIHINLSNRSSSTIHTLHNQIHINKNLKVADITEDTFK